MVPIAEHGYLLGIGSNLSPDDNIGHIVHHLLSQFDTMIVSSVLCFHKSGCSSAFECGDGSSGCDRGLCVVLVIYLVVLVQ